MLKEMLDLAVAAFCDSFRNSNDLDKIRILRDQVVEIARAMDSRNTFYIENGVIIC